MQLLLYHQPLLFFLVAGLFLISLVGGHRSHDHHHHSHHPSHHQKKKHASPTSFSSSSSSAVFQLEVSIKVTGDGEAQIDRVIVPSTRARTKTTKRRQAAADNDWHQSRWDRLDITTLPYSSSEHHSTQNHDHTQQEQQPQQQQQQQSKSDGRSDEHRHHGHEDRVIAALRDKKYATPTSSTAAAAIFRHHKAKKDAARRRPMMGTIGSNFSAAAQTSQEVEVEEEDRQTMAIYAHAALLQQAYDRYRQRTSNKNPIKQPMEHFWFVVCTTASNATMVRRIADPRLDIESLEAEEKEAEETETYAHQQQQQQSLTDNTPFPNSFLRQGKTGTAEVLIPFFTPDDSNDSNSRSSSLHQQQQQAAEKNIIRRVELYYFSSPILLPTKSTLITLPSPVLVAAAAASEGDKDWAAGAGPTSFSPYYSSSSGKHQHNKKRRRKPKHPEQKIRHRRRQEDEYYDDYDDFEDWDPCDRNTYNSEIFIPWNETKAVAAERGIKPKTINYAGDVCTTLNMVFVSGGFAEGEEDKFDDAVTRMLSVMDPFHPEWAEDDDIKNMHNSVPWDRYWNFFNIFSVYEPSPESGTPTVDRSLNEQHPGTNNINCAHPPPPFERGVSCEDSESLLPFAFDPFVCSPFAESADDRHFARTVVIAIANSNTYGGVGSQGYFSEYDTVGRATFFSGIQPDRLPSYDHKKYASLIKHEIGHAVGDLNDEYILDYDGRSYSDRNCQTEWDDQPPWQDLITAFKDPEQRAILREGVTNPGFDLGDPVPGCGSEENFRPSPGCMLNRVYDYYMCPVCRHLSTMDLLRPPLYYQSCPSQGRPSGISYFGPHYPLASTGTDSYDGGDGGGVVLILPLASDTFQGVRRGALFKLPLHLGVNSAQRRFNVTWTDGQTGNSISPLASPTCPQCVRLTPEDLSDTTRFPRDTDLTLKAEVLDDTNFLTEREKRFPLSRLFLRQTITFTFRIPSESTPSVTEILASDTDIKHVSPLMGKMDSFDPLDMLPTLQKCVVNSVNNVSGYNPCRLLDGLPTAPSFSAADAAEETDVRIEEESDGSTGKQYYTEQYTRNKYEATAKFESLNNIESDTVLITTISLAVLMLIVWVVSWRCLDRRGAVAMTLRPIYREPLPTWLNVLQVTLKVFGVVFTLGAIVAVVLLGIVYFPTTTEVDRPGVFVFVGIAVLYWILGSLMFWAVTSRSACLLVVSIAFAYFLQTLLYFLSVFFVGAQSIPDRNSVWNAWARNWWSEFQADRTSGGSSSGASGGDDVGHCTLSAILHCNGWFQPCRTGILAPLNSEMFCPKNCDVTHDRYSDQLCSEALPKLLPLYAVIPAFLLIIIAVVLLLIFYLYITYLKAKLKHKHALRFARVYHREQSRVAGGGGGAGGGGRAVPNLTSDDKYRSLLLLLMLDDAANQDENLLKVEYLRMAVIRKVEQGDGTRNVTVCGGHHLAAYISKNFYHDPNQEELDEVAKHMECKLGPDDNVEHGLSAEKFLEGLARMRPECETGPAALMFDDDASLPPLPDAPAAVARVDENDFTDLL